MVQLNSEFGSGRERRSPSRTCNIGACRAGLAEFQYIMAITDGELGRFVVMHPALDDTDKITVFTREISVHHMRVSRGLQTSILSSFLQPRRCYVTARRPRPQPIAAEQVEESYEELQRSLPGTVQAHRCLVLLDSQTPSSEFAARHSTRAQRDLQLRIMKLGGLVNFAWFGTPGNDEEPSGVAYTPTGGRLLLPVISPSNIESVVQTLTEHMSGSSPVLEPETHKHVDILVCTHGARDCRCGDTGGNVYAALQKEVQAATARMKDEGVHDIPSIRVGQVGHVGGHKYVVDIHFLSYLRLIVPRYAANVLVYPQGEWLGLITPADVPELVSSMLKSKPRPLTREDPLQIMPDNWRGRMGLGKDEQADMYKEHKSISQPQSP